MKKIVYVLIMLAALLTVAAQAAQITLTNFSTSFNTPIGIDYHEPNGGNLILSANYPTGTPNNLDLIQIPSGTVSSFSNLVGLKDELKIATVRNAAGCQQFPVGDIFTGNGVGGEIVRVDATGNVYPPAAINPGSVANRSWVALPGSSSDDLLRGSLYVDRFCAFGGDLIVVTGNDDITGGGKVWRVKVNGTAQLLTSIIDPVTNVGVHLEGVITLPNDPKYGVWAGTIIAGDENVQVDLKLDGRIWSITAGGMATPYNLSYTENGVHHPMKAEDLDLIEPGGDFFGVNFEDNRILTAPDSSFTNVVGDILLTQEFPCGSTSGFVSNGDCIGNASVHRSGLYAIRHVGSGGNAAGGLFRVEEFTFNGGVTDINQWEHVTIAPRGDVKVTKSTTTPNINAGQTASFDILVEALGPADSFNVVLTDTLPGTGWILSGTNAAACQPFDGQHLSCNFGTIPHGQSRTVTLSRATTTNDCGRLDNTAVVTSINDRDNVNNTSSTSIIVNCGKTFTIGPSSMEGAIIIDNGDWVNGGYSFKFKNGSHTATNFTVAAKVTITGPCSNGGTDTLTISLGTVTYPVPAGNKDWLPTGDQNSVLSWQGSVIANVCGGVGSLNASKGAVYTATVSQNPPSGSLVDFRFKYRDPAAKGKPNTNCLDTSDPNRNKADVCGASWSQTVTDP